MALCGPSDDAIFEEIFGKPEQRARSPELTDDLATTDSKPQNCSTQICETPRRSNSHQSCGDSQAMAAWETIDYPPDLGQNREREVDISGLPSARTVYEPQQYPNAFNGPGKRLSEPLNAPSPPEIMGSDTHAFETSNHDRRHGLFGEFVTNEIVLDPQHLQTPNIGFNEDLAFQLYNQKELVIQDDFGSLDFMYQPGSAASMQCSSSVFEVIENVLSFYISQLGQLTDAIWKRLSSVAMRMLLSWTKMDEFVHCLVRSPTRSVPTLPALLTMCISEIGRPARVSHKMAPGTQCYKPLRNQRAFSTYGVTIDCYQNSQVLSMDRFHRLARVS